MMRRRLHPLFRLMLLALSLAPLPARLSAHGTGAGASFPANLSRQQQEELLGYAKGVFLARQGFGYAVQPPEGLQTVQRACFVTFFAGKRVIACFGGFQPRTPHLVREIEANVAGALRNDPRARRITRDMAQAAGVQITFPGGLAPITDYRGVDPSREGLFVENDRQGVAIVPGEAKTSAWAYREAMRRLGEKEPAGVRLYKFRATFLSTRGNG